MINKNISFLQARKFQKWLNLKENNKTICILADEKRKNDIFLFIMETWSLEARNIWLVNSNLSRVQESK
jgi:hypothetical protein